MRTHIHQHTITTLLVCLALAGILLTPTLTQAAESDLLSGWAWSSNIGWISMNCTNTDSCEDVEYGVSTVGSSEGDQLLSGWAWSSNVGWIDFSQARMSMSDQSLHGYAVVYNTVAEPYCSSNDSYQTDGSNRIGERGGTFTCSDSSQDDGWNGVISLSDTSPISYGPEADTDDDVSDGWTWPDGQYNLLDGYAWGGDILGWIKFSCQDSDGVGPDTNTCGTVGYGVYIEPFSLSFTANKGLSPEDPIENGGSYTHSWTVEPSSGVTCKATAGPESWTAKPDKHTDPEGEGNELVENVVGEDSDPPGITSTLVCTMDGKSLTQSVFIHTALPPPSVRFTTPTTDSIEVPYNTRTTLAWVAQNVDECIMGGGDEGWRALPQTQIQGSYTTENITSSRVYTLECSSSSPGYEDPLPAQVLVEPRTSSLELYAEDSRGSRLEAEGLVSYTEKDEIKLVWETQLATGGCQAGGDWSGEKVSPSLANNYIQGSENLSLPNSGTYTFTLTCRGEDSNPITRSVTLRVARNPGFSEEITSDE